MVKVKWDSKFKKKFDKLSNNQLKIRIHNLVKKIIRNPEIGKPMRYSRKHTREVYVGSHRLMYRYFLEKDIIQICDIYHKDEQ